MIKITTATTTIIQYLYSAMKSEDTEVLIDDVR